MTEPAVALFWGEQPYLLRLAALTILQGRGVHATEVAGREWQGGETADLATPSLWGERRALLVTGCQALPEAGSREVRSYVEAPAPDAVCVLTLVSAARTLPPLAKVVQGAGGLVRQVALKRQDLPSWVQERAHRREFQLSAQAAAALVATLGEDPAVLDQAVEQLMSAFPGRSVGPDDVAAQFRGLGEQKVWDLCDQALTGRLPQALVTLRGLLEGQDDPLLILGGIASRLRDLLKVKSVSEGLPSSEAARAAGLRFDWQVRRYREQGARFSVEGLTALHRHAGEADRAIKGGAPGDVVLAGLVAEMAGQQGAALDVPVRVGR
jgi:DNA polymerase III subunit delta